MARRGGWALALVLGLSLGLSLGATGAARACDLPGNAAALASSAGAAMNAQRQGNGMGALSRDARLDQAAQNHACWMSRTGTFSHKGQGGSTPKTRVKRTGYASRLTAENIAFGQTGGAEVVSEWMGSQGHRANILRRGVSDFGIGVALMNGRPVWVMVFAQPR